MFSLQFLNWPCFCVACFQELPLQFCWQFRKSLTFKVWRDYSWWASMPLMFGWLIDGRFNGYQKLLYCRVVLVKWPNDFYMVNYLCIIFYAPGKPTKASKDNLSSVPLLYGAGRILKLQYHNLFPWIRCQDDNKLNTSPIWICFISSSPHLLQFGFHWRLHLKPADEQQK